MSEEYDTKTLEQTIDDLKKYGSKLPFLATKYDSFIENICRTKPLESDSFNLSVYTDDQDGKEGSLVDSTFVVSPALLSNVAPLISDKLSKYRTALRKTCGANSISYIFHLALNKDFSHYSFTSCFNPGQEGINLSVKPITSHMLYITPCSAPDTLPRDELVFLDDDKYAEETEKIDFELDFDSVLITCVEYAIFFEADGKTYTAMLLDTPAMKYAIALREQ